MMVGPDLYKCQGFTVFKPGALANIPLDISDWFKTVMSGSFFQSFFKQYVDNQLKSDHQFVYLSFDEIMSYLHLIIGKTARSGATKENKWNV